MMSKFVEFTIREIINVWPNWCLAVDGSQFFIGRVVEISPMFMPHWE